MKIKSSFPLTYLEGKEFPPFIEFYFEFNHLKQLFRQGWLKRGVSADLCESVAEHTLGVALLALFLADTYFPELDLLKILKMALIHDLGEVYTGDLTPDDPIDSQEKYQSEVQSVYKILDKFPNGRHFIKLWEEYEVGTSPEAKFVRQIDRLEMGLQAGVYEHQGFNQLSEFFVSTEKSLEAPELKAIFHQLKRLRP